MRNSRVAPRKDFQLEDARKVLPLVRAIVTDLVELRRRTSERESRLDGLGGNRDSQAGDPYTEELQQMRREIEVDKRRAGECRRELRELGVVPDESDAGVVRFPSHRDQQPVWLCWRLGDTDVAHWSPRDAEPAEWIPIEVGPQPT